MTVSRYEVLEPIRLDGRIQAPGAQVDLSDRDAQALMRLDPPHVRPVASDQEDSGQLSVTAPKAPRRRTPKGDAA